MFTVLFGARRRGSKDKVARRRAVRRRTVLRRLKRLASLLGRPTIPVGTVKDGKVRVRSGSKTMWKKHLVSPGGHQYTLGPRRSKVLLDLPVLPVPEKLGRGRPRGSRNARRVTRRRLRRSLAKMLAKMASKGTRGRPRGSRNSRRTFRRRSMKGRGRKFGSFGSGRSDSLMQMMGPYN